MNWLNNTCNDEKEKKTIIRKHRETSDIYKSLVHFSEIENDILVNIKNFMVLGRK